ncbi:MAG: RNA methyltransferase [Flavobacteriales bacterium]|jgi:tRNA (guanosine-2'-O-)-methyltransferase|nr:RNA methyltransferase [Flavobacteriales bacterium]
MSKLRHDLVQYLKEFIVEERRELFEEKIKQRTKHITVVLENVFQGRNISASIRSADCFGVQDVHVIENDNIFNDDPEVSMGADKWVSTTRYNQEKNNTAKAIKKLKADGYQIIATTPHNTDCDLYDIKIIDQKIALIFGSEVKGCSEQTLKLADRRMRIPMYGFTESFNISVSVSLCLQHLIYKMRNSAVNWRMNQEQQDKTLLKWLRNSIKSSTQIEEKYLKFQSKKSS